MKILTKHFLKHMIWWFRRAEVGELTGDRTWVISPSKNEDNLMVVMYHPILSSFGIPAKRTGVRG